MVEVTQVKWAKNTHEMATMTDHLRFDCGASAVTAHWDKQMKVWRIEYTMEGKRDEAESERTGA